jgi:hypothetical protein
MNDCERIQTLLPEYWAESMPVAKHREVEVHLRDCPACQAEAETLGRLWESLDRVPVPEPSPQVRGRFYEMLDAYRSGIEEKNEPTPRSWTWNWWIPAGAFTMLAVGFLAGRLVAPSTMPADSQIAQLRGEMNGMRQMMALSLLQQQNPADRIRGVNYAFHLEKSNDEVIAALLDTVKSDPNVNVRLAAVDSFRKIGTSVAARRGLLDSLKKQDSPLVQIAIIELLVDLNDQTTTKSLQSLASDSALPKEVRERANWAAGQLN